MGWFKKKKDLEEPAGPRIMMEMVFPEVPVGFSGVDFLVIGRWTDEGGNDIITSNIYSEDPQEDAIDQYEIALGMTHVTAARMNQKLFRLRNPSGILPTPESDPSQFAPEAAVPDLEEVVGTFIPGTREAPGGQVSDQSEPVDWPESRERQHDLMRDSEYVSRPLHDHPCSDDTCTECYEVSKRMNKMHRTEGEN